MPSDSRHGTRLNYGTPELQNQRAPEHREISLTQIAYM